VERGWEWRGEVEEEGEAWSVREAQCKPFHHSSMAQGSVVNGK